jgi:hypothetical protein
MNPEVTIKQHLLEKSWEKDGDTFGVLIYQTHTVGKKDLQIRLRLEFCFAAPDEKRKVRVHREIAGEHAVAFDSAAGAIRRIVETQRTIPTWTPRLHTELTTTLLDNVKIGSVKEANSASEYMLEVMSEHGPLQFILGDNDQLNELRYLFTQAVDYHSAATQQAA